MENENQKINRIRLFADSSIFDSPRNELTKSAVAFRSGDGVRFDVVLFANGALADCSNISSIVFEILDIGAVNEPLLRAPTALVRKTVLAESLNTSLDAEGLAAGGAHFSLELSSAEASIGAGDRYLKICAFDEGGDRATFAAGWIKVFDDYCAELSDTPAASVNVAQQLQSEISAHETRIQSLEGEVQDLSGTAAEHASSIGGLSSGKADKATTLAGYGIADAYTKTETDVNLANKADKATTLAGYGIADAYTKTEADGNLAAALAPHSAQIGALWRSKANAGALCFGGGYLQTSNSIAPKIPLSICCRYKFSDFESMPTNAVENGGGFTFYKISKYINGLGGLIFGVGKRSSDDYRYVIYAAADGTSSYFKAAFKFTPDLLPHSVCAVLKSASSAALYVDGQAVQLAVEHSTLASDTLPDNPLTLGASWQNTPAGSAGVAEMSDFVQFNFDMEAAEAPYTVADYAAGKPVPPSLSKGGVIADTSALAAGDISTSIRPGASVSFAGGTITLTTDGGDVGSESIAVPLGRTIKKGEKIYVSLTVATATKWTTIKLTTSLWGGDASALVGGGYGTITGLYEVTATADANYIQFVKNETDGAVNVSASFEIFKKGAVAALENYAFNGEVLDASGNGAHCAVCGNVAGYNDIAAEALYQKIAARISNNS